MASGYQNWTVQIKTLKSRQNKYESLKAQKSFNVLQIVS